MKAKQQEEVKEVLRFTGMCPFQVVAVNPSLEELKSLGVTYLQQEPVYHSEKGLRLDFWLQNTVGMTYADKDGVAQNSGPLLIKTSIFLENNDRTSSTGKFKIVNNYGTDTWAESVQAVLDNPNMSWYSNNGIRVAKVGEVELLTFFHKLLGLSSGNSTKGIEADEVKFTTNWADIVAGNIKELKGYIQDSLKVGNGLTFLLGVKATEDGKTYQVVYMDYFQSSKNKSTKYMEKALSERTPSNFDYQNSLEFRLYLGSSTPVTPDASKQQEPAF